MPKFWTEPGRGRIQCPFCGMYSSGRLARRQCQNCGKGIPLPRQVPRPRRGPSSNPKVAELQRLALTRLAHAEGTEETALPAGKSPVRLEGVSRAHVHRWAERTLEALPGQTPPLSTLSWWLKYEVEGEDLVTARASLESWWRLYRRHS